MKKLLLVAAGFVVMTCNCALTYDSWIDSFKIREKYEKLSLDKKTQLQSLFAELSAVLNDTAQLVDSKHIDKNHTEALQLLKEMVGSGQLTLSVTFGTTDVPSEANTVSQSKPVLETAKN